MPAAQKTVGISSSVAVFLLIVSICCVLSLSSREIFHDDDASSNTKSILVPSYVPNIALICVMLAGIAAIVVFICKKAELTVIKYESQSTRRHDLHRKYSFYSIAVFYIGICMIDMNYLLVVFSCTSNWFDCWPNNMEYFLANVVMVIFHIVGTIFAVLQVVVCLMMRHMNFKQSQWVGHILAFVLAANITMWFHSLLRESYHRIEEQDEYLGAYFSFCNYTTLRNESDPFSCSDTSSIARWFLLSAPILFPITIEFNVLVTETLLDRSIGAESHNVIENAEEGDSDEENEMDTLAANANEPDEQTPLLPVNEYSDGESNSICSKLFIPISVLINIVGFVLAVLLLIGSQENDGRSQNFTDGSAIYRCIYYSLLAICCVVGMVSSRGFKRQQHSHTSFLQYILLLSTSGILFQSVKKIVAFSVNTDDWSYMLPAYYMTEVLDVVYVILQIVFYYYVKDVKFQFNNGRNASVRLSRIRSIIFVITVSNFAEWIISSFIYPQITVHITPTKDYVIEPWPAFDSVMIPLYIFFRFNSALLFWCIYRDLSPSRIPFPTPHFSSRTKPSGSAPASVPEFQGD